MHLEKKVCILLFLDIMSLYIPNIFKSSIMCHLRPLLPYRFPVDNLSIDKSGMLKSPAVTVLSSVSPFRC